jgi:hypothetical protein
MPSLRNASLTERVTPESHGFLHGYYYVYLVKIIIAYISGKRVTIAANLTLNFNRAYTNTKRVTIAHGCVIFYHYNCTTNIANNIAYTKDDDLFYIIME